MWVHTGEMGVVQTSKVHWKGASCPRHAGNGHLLNPEKEQGAHDQTPRAGLKKPHGGGGYRGCGRREGQGGGWG